MLTSDLDYTLPPHLIAASPANPRDSARLMVVHREMDRVEHRHIRDLPSLGVFRAGDVMVFNQTRVLPARFTATRVGTGGLVDGLYLASPAMNRWRVMLESGGTLRAGERLRLSDDAGLELLEKLGGGEWLAALDSRVDTLMLLDRVGSTPLPPYILKQRRGLGLAPVTADDAQRYNTVYAMEPGSAAAPTAGLHFTPSLLEAIDRLGVHRAFVTLHVGLGTFAPVRSETIEDHPIHAEWMTVPQSTLALLDQTRKGAGRIFPVGTTTVRALESIPPSHPLDQSFTIETRLLISPGFLFRFADGLLTNFHLPRSSLLALVAALPGVGLDRIKRWYQVAIEHEYRFYSYGDAMLLI